jgi:hypothetical protein
MPTSPSARPRRRAQIPCRRRPQPTGAADASLGGRPPPLETSTAPTATATSTHVGPRLHGRSASTARPRLPTSAPAWPQRQARLPRRRLPAIRVVSAGNNRDRAAALYPRGTISTPSWCTRPPVESMHTLLPGAICPCDASDGGPGATLGRRAAITSIAGGLSVRCCGLPSC